MKNMATRFIEPIALYQANALVRIQMARTGLPLLFIYKTAKLLNVSEDYLAKILNISKTSLAYRKRTGRVLSLAQTERLIGLIMLIGQVEAVMADAGESSIQFHAGAWMSSWLKEPLPALKNSAPEAFMDTIEGQRLVSRILSQNVGGAYV